VVGTIVVSFDFDPKAETITYCIIKKPWQKTLDCHTRTDL